MQYHYDMEIQRDEIRKRDQKYELLLEDFKKLGLENARLKKRPKGKARNPSKRIKIEEDKKTKKLQKEIASLKKQVYQVKEDAPEASGKWEEKYVADIKKHKKGNAEMKIWLWVEKIK